MKDATKKRVEMKIPKGVRLTGVELTEEFMQYKDNRDKLERGFANLFNKWVKEGAVKKIQSQYVHFNKEMWDGNFGRKGPHPKDVASLRHIKALPEVKELILSVFGEDGEDNIDGGAIDDVFWHIVERYKSYTNRNSTKKKKKFPKRGITLKSNKAMNFKDASIKIDPENKNITIKGLLKKHEMVLSFGNDYYGNLDLVEEGWRGGNLVFNSLMLEADNELVLLVYEEQEFDYFPQHFVAMDVNKNPENWITFSEPMENGEIALVRPENIITLEKIRDDFTKKLRHRKEPDYIFNSGQKRRMYTKSKKNMVRLRTAIEEIVDPIIQYFMDKYKGTLAFALDDVAIGSMPSFGQEDVRNAFVKLCVKNKIPFVIVPPRFTSQRCVKCGELTKQDRKTSNVYLCSSCGHFDKNCDAIGALNIKAFGEFLLNNFKTTSSSLSTKIGKKTLKQLYSDALKEEFNFPQS